jgi:hypothetical protein
VKREVQDSAVYGTGIRTGMVVYICNPSRWDIEAGGHRVGCINIYGDHTFGPWRFDL